MLKAAIALGFTLFTAAPPALAGDDAAALLTRLDAQYDKAWNTLDARKLADLFTPDAVFVPAVAPAGTGPQAVVAFFEPAFRNKWSDHKLEPVAARLVGDNILIGASHWSAKLADADNKSTTYHGDVAQVFEQTGGEWKLKLSSWNVLKDAQ
jgi:uncharacterized protein (TIGR02246 family)